MKAFLLCMLVGALAFGCKKGDDESTTPTEETAEAAPRGPDGGRCDTQSEGRDVREYDTSGDEIPDVRKVFKRMGDPPAFRLVLVCREADLDGNGTKDVVRYYSDEGRPLREEADRNFDGRLDEVTVFENGRIIEVQLDTNGDGRIDTKMFYEAGRLERAERDIAGRSTTTQWHPNQWEYFENGRMIRMGTDLDGDGRVDTWDRDEGYRRELEEAETRAALEAQRRDQAQDPEGEEEGDE